MQILVLGMHRSGTSAITRLINLMGAYIGTEGSLLEPKRDNPKGHWERLDVQLLHQEFLRSIGAEWYKVSHLDLNSLSEEQRTAFTEKARLIVQKLEVRRPWVLKDPRLCLLLPLWKNLLEIPACVLVYRSPLQVAQSLRTRNGFPISFGLALWEYYNLAALAYTRDVPRLLVSHQELITQPVETVRALHRELESLEERGLRCPSDKEILAFIEPALYHERGDALLEEQFANLAQIRLFQAFSEQRVLEWTTLPLLSTGAREALQEYETDEEKTAAYQATQGALQKKIAELEQWRARVAVIEQARTTVEERLQAVEQAKAAELEQWRTRVLAVERTRTTMEERLRTSERAREAEVTTLEKQVSTAKRALLEKETVLERLNGKVGEQGQDLKKLIQLVEQLDYGFRTVMDSKRWKLGHTFGKLYRSLRLKSAMPMPQDYWNDKIEKFHAWRRNYDAITKDTAREISQLPRNETPQLAIRANGRNAIESPVSVSQETYKTFLKRSLLTKQILAPFGEEEEAIKSGMEWKKSLLLQNYLMRPQEIKVSIIMPTFNRDYIIDRAIRSVQNQYYKNWELFIVDDGGTDKTEMVVEKYCDNRIVYAKLKENRKAAGARNVGLAKASGTYIAYLDSDNEWHQEYLLLMVNTLKEHAAFESIYSAQAVFKKDQDLNSSIIDHIRFGLFHRALLENKNYIDLNAFMHTRRLYMKYGGFDEFMRRIEDWEFILRCTQEAPPFALDCVLGNYYHDEDNHAKKEEYGPYLKLLREKIGFRKLDILNPEKILPQRSRFLFSNTCTKENTIPPERVSIVIPSYEAPECLMACVDAIKKYTKKDFYQIIIVDNASSSEEVRNYLRSIERSDQAIVRINQTNFGFTYAVNQGIQLADPANDIVIMNNDAVVTDGWLEALSEVKHLVDDVGIIAPRQVLPPFSETMQTHVPFCREAFEIDVNLSLHHDNIHDPQFMLEKGFVELTFVPFFCVYVTRRCINAAGLLDHVNARHYRSDTLYCDLISKKHKFKIIYTPYSKVYHLLQRATKDLKRKNVQMYKTMFVENKWLDVSPPQAPSGTVGRGGSGR